MDNFYEEYFSYDEIQKEYDFLKTSHFGKIYKEFNNKSLFEEEGKKYCTQLKLELPVPHDEDLIFNFCNNLYKIIVKVNDMNNGIFEEINKDDKMYCFTLKYWLYDQIKSNGARGLKINEHFEKWQKEIKDKINNTYSNPCTFNELEEDQYNKLKSIYAFVLLYYNNINDMHKKKFVLCKYLNYFGKGLKAYYESITKCSSQIMKDNYCKEFDELVKIYNLDKFFWKNSTCDTEYIYVGDTNVDCPLVIESLKDPLRLIYKEGSNILHLSGQSIDIPITSIISASSAIGATVGISAFLLYLYKYTSLSSLFGHQPQKDNIMFDNMNTEAHNFTQSTFEIGNTNFENSDYNILYALNNS